MEYLEGGEIPDPVLEMERPQRRDELRPGDDDGHRRQLLRPEPGRVHRAVRSYFAEVFAGTYYDLMRLEPTAYLSYYLGWMKIEALKEQAEKALDDAYTDLGFHTSLLRSGSVPYFHRRAQCPELD